MKRLAYSIGIILFFCCLGCSGFLDRYPEDAIEDDHSWENKNDFDYHWRGVYATLKNADGFGVAARLYGDIQCDLAYRVQEASSGLQEIYNWTFTSQSSVISSIYYAMWYTIAEANRMFDRLPEMRTKVSGADSLDMEMMMGDMYMARALCYSKLVEYYCDAYDPAAAEQQLGMPLCRSARDVGHPARASLKATYDFIYDDLSHAVELLDSITVTEALRRSNFLFSKQAALALWARMALYQKDYETAAAKATKALQICLNGGMELDRYWIDSLNTANTRPDWQYYPGLFYGKDGQQIDAGEELMFFIGMDENDVEGAFGTYFCIDTRIGYYSPEYVPSESLIRSYGGWDQGKPYNDIRQLVFFDQQYGQLNGQKQFMVLIKDIHNAELDLSAANPVYQSRPKLFRMSELYLIIAEAHAQMLREGGPGDLQTGIDHLVTIWRARTSGGKILVSALDALESPEALLQAVKEERKKELCFEGFRLADLKRWGEGFSRSAQPYTASPENELMIHSGNPRFTWPIPLHELEVNPNMKPNKSN